MHCFLLAFVVFAGRYEFTLRVPPSGLIAGEEVQIEFRITDATQVDPVAGKLPIVRAKIETQIDMPDMPSMPKRIEVAHPEGVPGDYGIHPTFPHGGKYRMLLKIEPPGGEPFSGEIALEVGDASDTRKPPPPRYRLELTSGPKNPKAGQPAELRFFIRDRDNPRQPVTAFDTVHEKLMHLILVSKDLNSFEHLHPEQRPEGSFTLSHAFPRPGEYHLWADVAPKDAGAHILFAKIKVSGKPETPSPVGALSLQARTASAAVEIAPPEHPMQTGKTKIVPVRFEPAIRLENYLGAQAHLILIHEDAETFVHCHPDERQPARDGIVPFLVRLPKPGSYRAWLQFRHGGVLHTAEFKIEGASR